MDREGDAVRVLVVDDSPVFAECIAAGLRFLGGADVEVFDDEVTIDALLARLARSPRDAVVIDLDLEPGFDLHGPLTALKGVGVAVFVITAFDDPATLGRHLAHGASGVFVRSRAVDELIHALDDAMRGRTALTRLAGSSLAEPMLGTEPPPTSESVRALLDRLTPSERAVLDLVADGLPAKVVARERGVSVFTVRAQIRSILTKLGVNSQLAAVALVRRHR